MTSLPKLFFENPKMSVVWLMVRLYVGWVWIETGLEKVKSAAWVGTNKGAALTGFIQGALQKTVGDHPDVSQWYAAFLRDVVLPHAQAWSVAISYGELLVGVGLILGALTGIAAFFGFFMNLNYLMAGTVSVNPQLLILSLGLMLAWRMAGYIGVDYVLLPQLMKGKRT